MKKKLGIVTASSEMGVEYIHQLKRAFGESFDMVTYSFEANDFESLSNVDALLISTLSQYQILQKSLSEDTNIIISKLTISKSGYDRIKTMELPANVMLVNLSFEMCIETIATLQQLGIEGVEMTPVYPNMEKVPQLDFAITTGESRFVPNQVTNVLDLGHRLIDKGTILEIAVALDLEDQLTKPSVSGYFDNLASYEHGVEFLISKSSHLNKRFKTLLSIMDKGVISIKDDLMIENCNEVAKNMMGRTNTLVGSSILSLFPKMDFKRFLKSPKPILNQLMNVDGHLLTVSFIPIRGLDETEDVHGMYMLLENFESEEDKQNMLRLQLANKGHVARYTVDSIIGQSVKTEDIKHLVLRMANSKSAILITGESGTGKELTAQAIHNASPLRDKQFVAINCAAIAPHLLESELFGYEAGAFTGAAKSGKIGILELAHNGTLFLDEIGELPMDLQAKLLRVIQEKEVMRVGGSKIIKVNFRVIAATNKNLLYEVNKGNFRQDLFYRINVLPIHLPPLRERTEDIPLLMETIKRQEGYDFRLSEALMRFLMTYEWHGNIRELRNCIEFLGNIGKEVVEVEDLPHYIASRRFTLGNPHALVGTVADRSQNALHDAIDEIASDIFEQQELFVLNLLYESFKSRKRLGRRTLSERAFAEGLHLSEYDIRAIMNRLKARHLIQVSSGRGGSTISPEGIAWLKNTLGH